MNLDDLKNFDIKNIDLKNLDINKILTGLLDQKDLLAQIVVIIISVFILVSFGNGYRDQSKEYRQQIDQMKEKVAIIDEYKTVVKNKKEFLTTLPEALDEDSLSSQIGDYASQNKISIISFLPGQKRTEKVADILTARLSIQFAEYKDLLAFIKAIEGSAFALRIDTCVLSIQNTSQNANKIIEAQMEIASVGLKK